MSRWFPLFLLSVFACGSVDAGRMYDTRDPHGVEVVADHVSKTRGDALPTRARFVNDAIRVGDATLRQRTTLRGACVKNAEKARASHAANSPERCD